jgi:antitoxin component YwqK of YwqJK toxin-antitoxin module
LIKISSIILLLTCINLRTAAQFDFEKQLNKPIYTADIIDPVYGILLYEPLNMFTRSDSSRMEGGYAINGWKEDHYSDGQLLHKGYYIEGQLKVYKNYYPNGNLERNFKSIDGFRSKAILYFENGNLKSEVLYTNDFALEWTDYYINGQIEFYEKYHKNQCHHLDKISYYENGQIESELILENKKKYLYSYNEYHSNGSNKLKGNIKYDMGIFDYVKYGTWSSFDEQGNITNKENY